MRTKFDGRFRVTLIDLEIMHILFFFSVLVRTSVHFVVNIAYFYTLTRSICEYEMSSFPWIGMSYTSTE